MVLLPLDVAVLLGAHLQAVSAISGEFPKVIVPLATGSGGMCLGPEGLQMQVSLFCHFLCFSEIVLP